MNKIDMLLNILKEQKDILSNKNDFYSKELELGKKEEEEHRNSVINFVKNLGVNPDIPENKKLIDDFITQIAVDHINQVSDYYTKLKKYVESDEKDFGVVEDIGAITNKPVNLDMVRDFVLDKVNKGESFGKIVQDVANQLKFKSFEHRIQMINFAKNLVNKIKNKEDILVNKQKDIGIAREV